MMFFGTFTKEQVFIVFCNFFKKNLYLMRLLSEEVALIPTPSNFDLSDVPTVHFSLL